MTLFAGASVPYQSSSAIGEEEVGLGAGEHGSLDYEELERLGLNAGEVLDFSANVNPYGPAEKIRDALAFVALDRYPDRHCLALCQRLEEFLGVSRERILPGNGASELIWLTAAAFVRPGDHVLVIGPTFCEYARSAKLMGASVALCLAKEEADFVPNLTEIRRHLKAFRPRLVFVCNPNNPTGAALAPETVAGWAREYPQTLFVVDEAYLPFAAGLGSGLVGAEQNVLVLRSMTKDFCLAGLRLGYAVGAPKVVARLRRVQPPWSVNALAQAAGVTALESLAFREISLAKLAAAKRELVEGLVLLGIAPRPSPVHFFLCSSPRFQRGVELRAALLRLGVLVRDCASFGLPAYVRIAARTSQENAQLLAALREVI